MLRRIHILPIVAASLTLAYIVLYCRSVAPYWFNPNWTTDDGLQQLFPLHSVYHPHIFQGDLIADVMRGYLAPLHWGISYLITLLTRDPVMTGHWVNLIQLALAAVFLFLLVKARSAWTPAFFALLWFFHTRHLVQRTTGGIPRGWAPLIFTAVLYFTITSRHRAVLLALLLGCLLNPPATFLAAFSYGLFVSLRVITRRSRKEAFRPFLELALCAPVFAGIVLYIAQRPEEVGQMATYSEAIKMPEFQKAGGRFAFLPFDPPVKEIKRYGFQAFTTRLYQPARFWKANIYYFVAGILLLLLLSAWLRKRELIPPELLLFGLSSLLVYFLARETAFLLYVPDRHLRAPLAVFFISAFSIGVWRLFWEKGDTENLLKAWRSGLALALLGVLIYCASGDGLYGNANFNFNSTRRGLLTKWLKENTPEDSLVAGFPITVDPVPLFAMRRVYAASEPWHPFYKGYNEEMKKRIGISLRAHYARTLQELVNLAVPEGIDYFVFERGRFYPDALRNAVYMEPFRPLLKDLTSRDPDQYAYRRLPEEVDLKRFPFMPFKDKVTAIVDIAALRDYLRGHPEN